MPNAIPGVSSSTPPAQSRSGGGFLRVVSPDELNQQDEAASALRQQAAQKSEPTDDLSAFIRQRWMIFRNHRNQGNDPLNARLLRAQRMFEGKYDPEILAEIKRFGGSEVYSRLVAVKCRGATSLLRDVYLGQTRPWDIEPQPDPPVPPEIKASIVKLVATEVGTQQQAGQPILTDQVHMRMTSLLHAAQQAARRSAITQSDAASDKIDDILQEGGFYDALTEFLIDLPLFPFACIKGPVVKMVPKLTWDQNNKPSLQNTPQMFWERVDPFMVYYSPGVSRIEDAEVIEKKRLTRKDLNDLLGLPGYDQEAVRGALQDYARGLRDWMDYPDTESALNEGREDPNFNQSMMIDAIEYHGNVQGSMLLAQGVDSSKVPDPDRDYSVQSWVVGRHVLKTQINPSPRQRHPYFMTSFEKVPGTVHGHGLPDILEDMQQICNATLRALVNNMGIASGPQVVVNEEVLAPGENGDEIYPWKRWRMQVDPMANGNTKPVDFFQPQSNSQELLQVYSAISSLADDISAIPRYVTGESLSGGAGRTASGLSMLMGNSQKILQTVAANVDTDVMKPLLGALYDMIMLTDTSGMLTGQEQIKVNGVNVALQKETERQKQLQFLQITANPIDAPIIGPVGRARVLRSVAQSLGLPDDVVPDDDTMEQQVKAQQQAQALAVQNGQQPGQPGQPGQPPQQGQKPAPSPGAQTQGNQAPTPTPARLADHAPPQNMMHQGVPTNVQ